MAAELTSITKNKTLVLTLSNPGKNNSLTPDVYAAGVEALNGAEGSAEVRSVVLTGAAAVFSSGQDLACLQSDLLHPEVQAASVDALNNWIETIRAFPKPVIAAVEGSAAAAGFSLVLACDLVVASRSARFSLPSARAGLCPDGGSSWAVAQAVPRALAMEWLMLGEEIASDRLHALGLINRLSEPGEALADALRLSDSLNALAPNVLAVIKELLFEARGSDLHGHLARERQQCLAQRTHPNAAEGIDASLRKRVPLFR